MSVRRLQLVDPAPGPAPADNRPHLRVAIATQDMQGLNAHFGSARKFAIYDVTPDEAQFVEAVAFDTVSDESASHREGDDRIAPKVAALAGCNLLFVLAIGGPAAARVVNAHIHPVKLAEPMPIDAVLGKVQAMMAGNPPPWLRKAMMGGQRSMSFLDDDDE